MTSEIGPAMRAAVYRGQSLVAVENIEVPRIGVGEILVRVEACGVCHTDLKKVEYDLLPPPRIYGHETAGTVVMAGKGVTKFAPGDRVALFHHVPCLACYYCDRKLYAQCPGYKRVGITAGFEPAGGGFAQYVRVMDWVADRGVEKIPPGVPFEIASFVEPVNTCLKAVMQLNPDPGDVAVVIGQGPIGLIFTMLLARRGVRVIATDTVPRRLEMAKQCGANTTLDPRSVNVAQFARSMTEGRGADQVVVATAVCGIVERAIEYSRPGAKILLFAQTANTEQITLPGASICVGERALFGSYSSSPDLQAESARLVFSGELPVRLLVSHRFPLERIEEAFDLAKHPTADSLKIIINPHE